MMGTAKNLCVALALVFGGIGACGDSSSEKKPTTAAKSAGAPGGEKKVQPEKKKDLPAAEDLIEAHVEAIGGRAAISNFKTLYFESSVDTGAQNIRASAKTWWKQGHFYGEQDIPGFGTARSGYDGATVWVDDPINQLRKLEGQEAEQIIREGAIFLVADWKEHFKTAETIDERELEGGQLFDVELKSESGDQVVMSFSGTSKLLSQMAFKQITPTGTVPVTAVFEDYREVEGVKFAHRSKLEIALGTVTQTYDKIEVNSEVDESKFAFPGSAGAVPAKPEGEAPTAADGPTDKG